MEKQPKWHRKAAVAALFLFGIVCVVLAFSEDDSPLWAWIPAHLALAAAGICFFRAAFKLQDLNDRIKRQTD